jgi:NAD-dependent SIR2 family protein deacetylase
MVNDLQFRSGSDVSVQKEVAAIIKRSSSMVAFTGAGISTSAGISDFRGQKGIYMTGEYPPTIFDIDTFKKN